MADEEELTSSAAMLEEIDEENRPLAESVLRFMTAEGIQGVVMVMVRGEDLLNLSLIHPELTIPGPDRDEVRQIVEDLTEVQERAIWKLLVKRDTDFQ